MIFVLHELKNANTRKATPGKKTEMKTNNKKGMKMKKRTPI
jgi:hypothetical protein